MARFGCNSRSGMLERQTDTAVYSTQATMQIEETEVKPGRRLNYNLFHFGISTQEMPFPQINLILLARRIWKSGHGGWRTLPDVCRVIRLSHPSLWPG